MRICCSLGLTFEDILVLCNWKVPKKKQCCMFGTLKQVTVQCYILYSEGIKKNIAFCILYLATSKEKSLNGMQVYQIVHT